MKQLSVTLLGLWLLAAGCGSDPAAPTGPVRLSIEGTVPATLASGSALSPSLTVQAMGSSGSPSAQRGILITASVGVGSAGLSGITELRTDDQGRAVFTGLVITGAPGEIALRFSAPGLAAAVSGRFQLVAGAAAGLQLVAGSGQVAAAGTAVPTVPTFRVVDGSGNGVAGVTLTIVASGGGSVATPSPVTDGTGVASVGAWTLGTTPGNNALTASFGGGPEIGITALGVVGPPAKLTVIDGNGQSAVAGQPVLTPPSVRVTDAFDNPIGGVTITFAVTAGGGTVAGNQPRSDAAGVATVGGWTLGPEAGPNALSATRAGVPSAVVSATAEPVPVVVLGGGNQLGFVGSELRQPLTVRVVNGLGAPRADVTVTFAVTAGGGTLSATSVTTDTTGTAASQWTLGSAAGTNTVTVSATGAAPTSIAAEGVRFRLVSSGRFHACGLTEAGIAYCWGDNRFGQIGDSTFIDRTAPTRVVGGHVFDSLTAGTNGHFSCGITTDGESWCWGSNRHGQTGIGSNLGAGGPFGNSQRAPVQVTGGLRFVALTAGGDHACGLIASGAGYCWGRGFNGELGNGGFADQFAPTPVLGGFSFLRIGSGDGHTCGLEATGAARCWGRARANGIGQTLNTPGLVPGGHQFIEITGGAFSSCARTVPGIVYCWGENGSGQLGDGTTVGHNAPAPVAGGASYAQVVAGGVTACARASDGSVSCWGANDQGQTGTGSFTTQVLSPTGVVGGRLFSRITVGQLSSCGLEAGTGAVYCWGANSDGQLGDGTFVDKPAPTLVRF